MRRTLGILLLLFFPWSKGIAEEPSQPAPLNLKSPTLGGKLFWTDELIRQGWRVQRYAYSNHYRLLDENDVRHAWGSEEQCLQAWEKIVREQDLPPVRGKVVILLHGMMRSRDCMHDLKNYLQAESDYMVINFGYASRGTLNEHAASLAKVIDRLGSEVTEIHFVAHSLGNLVIRHYLGDSYAAEKVDSRIKRIVMLGPPNEGSALARTFSATKLLPMICGKSAVQLGCDWPSLEGKLATPRNEFAIIAGGFGGEKGTNPLLAGDDDFIVRWEETRLAGAADFTTLPLLHHQLTHRPAVFVRTLHFLEEGCFTSAAELQPIPLAKGTD